MKRLGLIALVMGVVLGFASQTFALSRGIHKMYKYEPPKCQLKEDVNRQSIANMIDELGKTNMGNANYGDNFGFKARDHYYLIRCYTERLGLALESFGANEDGLKKMVRERVMEALAERMKIVRSEALEVLAMIKEGGSRENIRPLIFRDHQQNLMHVNELLENGKEFGIAQHEVGLWDGELDALTNLKKENPPILMAMRWKWAIK